MTPSVVLLWDLDGTLLTTARAGILAFEAAVEETCGVPVDLTAVRTAGLTDAEVARLALRTAGLAGDDGLAERVLRSYERRLPDVLPLRRGHAMPGVVEVLEDLATEPCAASLLLTGNTQAGARAKLGHYGLARFFPHGGAFCEGPGPRVEIARRAVAQARDLLEGEPGERAVVIGDTPADVACGRAVGACTIGVATGAYGVEELEATGATWVLGRIPEPAAFRELLGLAG